MKKWSFLGGLAMSGLMLMACAHTSNPQNTVPRVTAAQPATASVGDLATAGDVATFKALIRRAEQASGITSGQGTTRGALGAGRLTDDANLSSISLANKDAIQTSATNRTGHMGQLNTTMLLKSGALSKINSGVSATTRKGHMNALNTTMLLKSGALSKINSGVSATTRKGHMHALNTTMLIKSGAMAKIGSGVAKRPRKGHMHALNTTMLLKSGVMAISESNTDRPNLTTRVRSARTINIGRLGGFLGDPSPIQTQGARTHHAGTQRRTLTRTTVRTPRTMGRAGGGRCFNGCHH